MLPRALQTGSRLLPPTPRSAYDKERWLLDTLVLGSDERLAATLPHSAAHATTFFAAWRLLPW
jgi:hypothetical protein